MSLVLLDGFSLCLLIHQEIFQLWEQPRKQRTFRVMHIKTHICTLNHHCVLLCKADIRTQRKCLFINTVSLKVFVRLSGRLLLHNLIRNRQLHLHTSSGHESYWWAENASSPEDVCMPVAVLINIWITLGLFAASRK